MEHTYVAPEDWEVDSEAKEIFIMHLFMIVSLFLFILFSKFASTLIWKLSFALPQKIVE